MIQSKDIPHKNILEYYTGATRVLKIPFSGTLELTPRCNMNCKMCYIRMNESEMKKVGGEIPVEEWIRIAREAVNEGMTMILLTGGEAMLYKDFKKLYLELRKMGLFISINTNGTLFNEEWIEFFKKNPPAKFNITIYGGSNETYNNLCGNPKGFDQLKYSIEQLQKHGFEILLNCTFTKQNIHDMEKIYEFGRNYNLPVQGTTYNFPPVRKEGIDNPELNRMTPKEAARARIRLNWNAINDKTIFLKAVLRTLIDLEKHKNMENDKTIGDKVLCAAGRSSFWITWDGRMLPCGMLTEYSIPIKNVPFKDAWGDIVKHTDLIRLAVECSTCPKKEICIPCAAKLKGETGSFSKKAEYKCEYTDEYIRLLGEAIRYFKK